MSDTIEDKLKKYILKRFSSLREFTIAIDMSYSTVDSILRRGVGNSSVTNIIKICKFLGISVDELANGNIVPIGSNTTDPTTTEITEILTDVKAKLTHGDGLTMNGKPIDQESINSLVEAMEIGEELANRKQKHNKNHNKTITES